MDNIQFVGTDKLSADELTVAKAVCSSYYGKLEREIKKITQLVIHIKPQSKGGNRKRYQVIARLHTPRKIFDSDVLEWDLSKALHTALEDIKKEIQHKCHTDNQHDKA